MKYLILLCLFLTACSNTPKLRFNQKVKVVGGFYEGCTGEVRDYGQTTHAYTTLLVCGSFSFTDLIKESDLEKI